MSSSIAVSPQLSVGGRVFWDVSGTGIIPHLVEGEILSLDDKTVTVLPRQRLYPDGDGYRPDPIFDAKPYPFRRSYFEQRLEERLHETSAFWAMVCRQLS